MMLFLFFMSIQTLLIDSNVKSAVNEFHILNSEKTELNFIAKHADSKDPSVIAYVTSISMKQAEYEQNPLHKLQLFETNRDLLNLLIKENSTNVHLRYVRLLSQEKTPFFLGYNGSIVEDKKFLKNILEIEDETDYLDEFIIANTSL